MDRINELFEKYHNNEYMKQRLMYHLNTLPFLLETEEQNREKRLLRSSQLILDQESFIECFLHTNNYFYLSTNNSFYFYDGIQYVLVTENDLNYEILKSITEHGTLLTTWKYKTKHVILRKIKQRPLFKSIPESETIQNILNQFYPTVFDSREETKYFLAIIGDALLKKYSEEDPVIFLFPSKAKKLLNEIETYVYNVTNIAHITSSMVTKFHETYDFNNCRLVPMKHSPSVTFLKEYCLEFLCVASYYSERFFNSETYLLSQCDEAIKEKVVFLKSKNKEWLFDDFLGKYFENGSIECKISWKSIHYLWKQYTSFMCLPSNILYISTLKSYFCAHFENSDEIFYKLTSKLLPEISRFLSFWETHIIIDETTELELDEIVSLYRHVSGVSISETSVSNILTHYFANIEICDNKYVLNVSCNLWKKKDDIFTAIQSYKTKNVTTVSIDTLYQHYLKQKFLLKMHTSKRFFKKFIETTLSEHMEVEQCLNLSNVDTFLLK